MQRAGIDRTKAMKTNSELEKEWEQTGYVTQPDPVTYLDTVGGTCFAQDYKRRTFEMLAPRPGARFLDVGCGAGRFGRRGAAYQRA